MEINFLKRKIEERICTIHEDEANTIIGSLNEAEDSKKMFKAARLLYKIKREEIFVHDHNKNKVESNEMKSKIIKDWFESKLYKNNHECIEQFEGPPRPLNVPITPW